MYNFVQKQEMDGPRGRGEGIPNRGAVTGTSLRAAPLQSGGERFDLTPLDLRVIALTAAGYSREERARLLGISRHNLHLHLLNVCSRLHVEGELELVLFTLYHRLIDTGEKSPPCIGNLSVRV